jgi:hypothetical protein
MIYQFAYPLNIAEIAAAKDLSIEEVPDIAIVTDENDEPLLWLSEWLTSRDNTSVSDPLI